MQTLQDITNRLVNQLKHFENLLKDDVFKTEQNLLRTQWEKLTPLNNEINQAHLNKRQTEGNIKYFERMIEKINSQNDMDKSSTDLEKYELELNQSKSLLNKSIQEINDLNENILAVKKSVDQSIQNLESQLCVTAHLAFAPTFSLATLAANVVIKKPVLTSLPEEVKLCVWRAQMRKMLDEILPYRINYLLTTNVMIIKSQLLYFITKEDGQEQTFNQILNTPEGLFIMALIMGDMDALFQILEIMEKQQLEFIEKNDYDVFSDLPELLGEPLPSEKHSFYAKLFWFFSIYYLDRDPFDPHSHDDEFKDFSLNNDKLLPIGRIAFKLILAKSHDHLSLKKLILSLAVMYDGIDEVMFFCERDPQKSQLIEFIKDDKLGHMAALFCNMNVFIYLLNNNLIDNIKIDALLNGSLPDFIENFFRNRRIHELPESDNNRLDILQNSKLSLLMPDIIKYINEKMNKLQEENKQLKAELDKSKTQTAHTPAISDKRLLEPEVNTNPEESMTNKKPKIFSNPHTLLSQHVIAQPNNTQQGIDEMNITMKPSIR